MATDRVRALVRPTLGGVSSTERSADVLDDVDEQIDGDELGAPTAERAPSDELPIELVPAIDPLLPPVPRTHSNGDGHGVEVADPVDNGDGEIEALRALEALEEARVAEPLPVPQPAPLAPSFGDDTSGSIPIITRRATVVGAERHLIAPVHRAVGRRPRVRKVTRVVRHVDPWTVFKVAAIFSLVVYGVLLTAGVLLWNVAHTTGTIDNIERFFESFGWTEFEFDGGQIYHSAWIAGLFVAVGLTGFAVLAATLFNLITDLVGGVRFTVLEEEVVEKTASPMRRFTVRRTETDPTPLESLRP
jgi:hypothetical protein